MIVIPARLGSTRFPNKILCDIFGLPMFIASAENAAKVDDVLIAVDDEKTFKIAKEYGFKAVMTNQNHQSGTDRINEAVQNHGLKDDEIIINLQADEPFFECENLAKFKEFATKAILKNGAFMASCFKLVDKDSAQNPNLVKVVLDECSNALYFSRSLIPYPREKCETFRGHIGIYAYSVKTLREFCSYQTSYLENIEKLEQLRALTNGKKIAMMKIKTKSVGIDTAADLEKALNLFKDRSKF
ncbi:3-deoxy-manno-octulosonate cytidylyltransferase [Campylobacter geochelonis]|uniref:3-deoxy-manno-octulosonate cytidylyltransferase n=1 Tax=Campylobacter geochelonis TaxID=1780362 RepID=A0A128EMZ8_9BACT|nr:3-deoxy-manno-octulosonate cytidylyltransferase [Campylobacter geochelonis]QKF71065.1 3-deoxy-D-manno-octulosonate cytidylyltransferase [Campylobacter geochelonis]CZE47240.1 3-deoxy-manno-octulosonate cytidylyltransferase [Campylobacter geochelonis]CZE48438.1 3-deoxy-manno-octulosonate cytidylyltransferase [Campylobacter geochelonis]CZE50119.1 3-deoxy-manno-octulosonate cytidylyltransferase [Campylobacter geochelonis]